MVDTTSVLGASIPNDRFVEIATAALVFVGLLAFLRYTRYGLIIRAGVENRAMVTALGIDVRTAFTLVFAIGGLAAGLAVLFLSFVVGGWAAGRIARYDGLKNGVMTGVWALVLIAILSGLGAWLGAEYNVLREADLPSWFSRDAATIGAIVSALAAILVMLAGGLLGGVWGERFHRRADAVIAGTRAGGISARAREVSP
jgi:branched-chain amino acid transport system permease protein